MLFYHKLVVWLPFLVAVTFGAQCIPPQSNFYWTTPCERQTFNNQITVTSMVATQNGKTVDSAGGIDATTDMIVVMNITDSYPTTVQNPLMDLSFQYYQQQFTGCKWIGVPTFGESSNKPACDIIDNCHLDNPANPTTLTATVNIDQLAGPFASALTTGVYYGVSLTFKEGTNGRIFCVYIQDKLIKTISS